MAYESKSGYYRWTICALLFFATTVNYIDRQVLGILADTIKDEIGWSETAYGDVVFAFQAAYALGMLAIGRLLDRFGTRLSFAVAIAFWSAAAMAHALARSAGDFAAVRFALGLGEAANFPACIKTVAEWFPRKERALATGVFNAGSNVGALVAPPLVAFLTLYFRDWRWAFIITGAIGFVWLGFWLVLYRVPRNHPRISPAELAHIESDPPDPPLKIAWVQLLPYRQTLAFALGKFLTDPIWWFYLYWLAKFFRKNYGLKLEDLPLPLVVIYLAADVGSIGGGGLSSWLLKRGWTVNAARKTAMLVCALGVVPVVFAESASQLWVPVALFSLATAAHQGWSANLFTTGSDLFPRRVVGSVVGLGGMAGAVGGMLFAAAAGRILDATGSYLILFLISGSAYLVAWAVIQALAPRFEPVAFPDDESARGDAVQREHPRTIG